jgi:hypothetical protein
MSRPSHSSQFITRKILGEKYRSYRLIQLWELLHHVAHHAYKRNTKAEMPKCWK